MEFGRGVKESSKLMLKNVGWSIELTIKLHVFEEEEEAARGWSNEILRRIIPEALTDAIEPYVQITGKEVRQMARADAPGLASG